jgi:hypothetical protein
MASGTPVACSACIRLPEKRTIMIPRTRPESGFSPVAKRSGVVEVGWDELVHEAFTACLEAGMTRQCEVPCDGTARFEYRLSECLRHCEAGWAGLDICLERWGQLSARALERALEEAKVVVECEPDERRANAGRAVLERAGERLARFWRDEATFAA